MNENSLTIFTKAAVMLAETLPMRETVSTTGTP